MAEIVETAQHDNSNTSFVIKLSPLVVLDAAKLKNKKRKKTVEERNVDALYAEHLIYQSHLRNFPGIPYIPVGGYGEDKVHLLPIFYKRTSTNHEYII